MAGPGGGPPRKSHTKSRKGCKTCKRRHIRCDETFPQCRNCTKHNCRCDYMDQPTAASNPEDSPASEVLLDAQVLNELRTWRTTGQTPYPELGPPSQDYWESFSMIDQRLLQHIAALSHDLQNRGYSRLTVWASKMPIFLALARFNDFVMHAVLAFSASHLAWMSGNSETQHLAYHHRGVAIKGLHEAIGLFSKESSEAILAASILLSWQATEWRDWASLQQGVSTVLNEMQPWLHETELGTFLQEQRASRGARTPVIPAIPLSHPATLEQDLTQLDVTMSHLRQVRQRVVNDEELVGKVDELFGFVAELKQDFPVPAPEQAFERLQKLRMWLFWLPPALLRQEDSDLGSIAVLAHFFSTALVIEPLFPEIGGSYFGSMAAEPIDEMRTKLLTRQAADPHERAIQVALSLTEFPHHTVMAYRSRQQYTRHADLYSGPSPISFSPGLTHRSSYTETMSPYRQESLNSPPANLTVPIPSPYLLPGRPSRPSSFVSQSALPSPCVYDPSTGQPFVHGTPVSMPGDFDNVSPVAPGQWNVPSSTSPHSRDFYFASATTPNELWI